MERLKGRWVFLIILFTGLTFSACKDSNDPVPPEETNYQYFVSSELNTFVTAQEIKQKLAFAQSVFPQVAPFVPLVKHNIEVQEIIYHTGFQDQDIEASGLVFLPKTAGDYPVLSLQLGTNTQHSQAPSVKLSTEMQFMLESVASMGFIVVVPDYIGFGISANLPHPYLHAQSTTQSILDMLRAMKEYSSKDKVVAKPSKDLFLYGYSQGGWATMLLQKEIETKYPTEFSLIASSCAAGPYSLEFMNRYISGKTDYPMPYFLAYLLNAYTSIGLVTNPLSDFVQAPYAALIPGLYDGNKSGSTINAALTTIIANLLTADYREHFATSAKFAAFYGALIANSVAPWEISTPTKLFHGAKDELIPAAMSENTLAELKTAGTPDAKIQLIMVPDVGHSDGMVPVSILTVLWFLELKK